MPIEEQVVITGGAGTLGQAIAKVLQQPGWNICAPSRIKLDIQDEIAVCDYFASKQVDLLICAAGMISDSLLIKLDEKAWDQTWSVNFMGASLCANAVLPGMIAKKAGHIVFISSYSAIHPPIGQVAYATAKAALLGLTRNLAKCHGSSNIRINTILPGFLNTQMTKNVTKNRRTRILEQHCLGRFNTCTDVARFIRFLHLDMPHTSGQIFQLDSRV